MRAWPTRLLTALMLSGCALVQKGEPLRVRYFVPDGAPPASVGDPPADGVELRLRLGRVTAGAELGQRMIVRHGGEVEYQEGLRWTERPEAYLRRDLAARLFERGPVQRVVAGPGPTLDVELVAFEELRGPAHLARFQAVLTLYAGRDLWLERTISEQVEVRGDGVAARVQALAEALARGVGALAAATEQALRAHRDSAGGAHEPAAQRAP